MKWAVLMLLATCLPRAWGSTNEPCIRSKGAEQDVTVHGRLAVYNGGYPNLRLLPTGSHHLFGIYGDAHDARKGPGDSEEDRTKLPENLDKAFSGENAFHIKLYGDFVIRPLERFRAGSMQPACIVSASHIVSKID